MTKFFFSFHQGKIKITKTMVEMTGFLYVVRYVNLAHAKKNYPGLILVCCKENCRIQINFHLHKSYIKKNTLQKDSECDTQYII